jgi:hypothetical protein
MICIINDSNKVVHLICLVCFIYLESIIVILFVIKKYIHIRIYYFIIFEE